MTDYIGARLSLISKSDIRYVGILHEIDSQNSTVSLEQVRSFGTEGRKGDPALEIPASDNVFEYIVFRGSDVKDLRVESSVTTPAPAAPAKPQDPAILETGPAPSRSHEQPRSGAPQQQAQAPYPSQQQPYGMPPQGYPGAGAYGAYPPQPFGGPPRGYPGYPGPMQGPPGGYPPMPPQQQGPGYPPQGRPQQVSQQQRPPQEGEQQQQARPSQPQAVKPVQQSPFAASVQDGFPELPTSSNVTQKAPIKTEGAKATQGKIVPALPLPQHASPAPAQQRKPATIAEVTRGVANLPSSGLQQQQTQQAQEAPKTNALLEVRRTMPKNAPTSGELQPKQQPAKQEQRRTASPSQQRTRAPRGQAQSNVNVSQPLEIPADEYDFAAANSKFEKPTEAEAEKLAEPSYNKGSSFFDSLSSESMQRASYQQQMAASDGTAGKGRGVRGQERALEMETFGETLKFTPGSRRGGRGRGRGGRGRGRGGQSQAQ